VSRWVEKEVWKPSRKQLPVSQFVDRKQKVLGQPALLKAAVA